MSYIDSNKNTKDIINKLIAELTQYQQLAEKFEKELILLPEGSLTQKVINGKGYYYQILRDADGSTTHKYLSKSNSDFVSGVKRRHFIQKSLKHINEDILTITSFLIKFHGYDATNITLSLPKVYQNQPEMVQTNNNEITSWQDKPYQKNELYPEGLVNYTPNGKKVRSKSEAIIAMALESNNIPYRYEAELKLGNNTYYPDFMILKPRDNEVIYWEHFGLMSNAKYSVSIAQKLISYTSEGIIPWDNFVMTFDNTNGSIDTQIIHRILKLYIL